MRFSGVLQRFFGRVQLQISPINGTIHAPCPRPSQVRHESSEKMMKKYQCIVCGWIYDEADGWPQDGIAPGTKWEDIPDDWTCPDCGVSKMDFEMIEI